MSDMNSIIRAGAGKAMSNPVGRDTVSSVPGTVQGNLAADIAGRAPDEVGTVQLAADAEPPGPSMNDLLRGAAAAKHGAAPPAQPARRSHDTAAWRQAITEAVLAEQQADPVRAFNQLPAAEVAEAELRRRYGHADFGAGTRGRQGQPAPTDASTFLRNATDAARRRGDI